MPSYDPMLVRWLNDELRVPTPVETIERDVANGFILGFVLQNVNKTLAGYGNVGATIDIPESLIESLKNSDASVSKLSNWAALQPVLQQIYPVSQKDIEAIATEQRGAAAKLLVAIKTYQDEALGKLAPERPPKSATISSPHRTGKSRATVGFGTTTGFNSSGTSESRTVGYVRKLMASGLPPKMIASEARMASFVFAKEDNEAKIIEQDQAAVTSKLNAIASTRTFARQTAGKTAAEELPPAAVETQRRLQQIERDELAMELTMAELERLKVQDALDKARTDATGGVVEFESRMRRQGLDPYGPAADHASQAEGEGAQQPTSASSLGATGRRAVLGGAIQARTIAAPPKASSAELALQRALPSAHTHGHNEYVARITDKFANSFRPHQVDEYQTALKARVVASKETRRDKETRGRLLAAARGVSQKEAAESKGDEAAVHAYLKSSALLHEDARKKYEQRIAKVATEAQLYSALEEVDARQTAAAKAFLDAERARLLVEQDQAAAAAREARLTVRAENARAKANKHEDLGRETVIQLIELAAAVSEAAADGTDRTAPGTLLPQQWRDFRQGCVRGRFQQQKAASTEADAEDANIAVDSCLAAFLPGIDTSVGLHAFAPADTSLFAFSGDKESQMLPEQSWNDLSEAALDAMDFEDFEARVGCWQARVTWPQHCIFGSAESTELRLETKPVNSYAIDPVNNVTAGLQSLDAIIAALTAFSYKPSHELLDWSPAAAAVLHAYPGPSLHLSSPLKVVIKQSSTAPNDVVQAMMLRLARRCGLLQVTPSDVIVAAAAYFLRIYGDICSAVSKSGAVLAACEAFAEVSGTVRHVLAPYEALAQDFHDVKLSLPDLQLHGLEDGFIFKTPQDEVFFDLGCWFVGALALTTRCAGTMFGPRRSDSQVDLHAVAIPSGCLLADMREKLVKSASATDIESFISHFKAFKELAAEAIKRAEHADATAAGGKAAGKGKGAAADTKKGAAAPKPADKEKAGKDKSKDVVPVESKTTWQRNELEPNPEELLTLMDRTAATRSFAVALAYFLKCASELPDARRPRSGGMLLCGVPSNGMQLIACEFAFQGPLLFHQRSASTDNTSPTAASVHDSVAHDATPDSHADQVKLFSVYAPEAWDGFLPSLLDHYEAGTWKLPKVGHDAVEEWHQACKALGIDPEGQPRSAAGSRPTSGKSQASATAKKAGKAGNLPAAAPVIPPSSSCFHSVIDIASPMPQALDYVDYLAGKLFASAETLADLEEPASIVDTDAPAGRRSSVMGKAPTTAPAAKEQGKKPPVSPRSEEASFLAAFMAGLHGSLPVLAVKCNVLVPPCAAEERIMSWCSQTCTLAQLKLHEFKTADALQSVGGLELALESLAGASGSSADVTDQFAHAVLQAVARGFNVELNHLLTLSRAYRKNATMYRDNAMRSLRVIRWSQHAIRLRARRTARAVLRVLRGVADYALPEERLLPAVGNIGRWVLDLASRPSSLSLPTVVRTDTGVTSALSAKLYLDLRTAFQTSRVLPMDVAQQMCFAADDFSALIWKHAESTRDAARHLIARIEPDDPVASLEAFLSTAFNDLFRISLQHFHDEAALLATLDLGLRGAAQQDVKSMLAAVSIVPQPGLSLPSISSNLCVVPEEMLSVTMESIDSQIRNADLPGGVDCAKFYASLHEAIPSLQQLLAACDARVAQSILVHYQMCMLHGASITFCAASLRGWSKDIKDLIMHQARHNVKTWLLTRDASLFGMTNTIKDQIYKYTPKGGSTAPVLPTNVLGHTAADNILPAVAQLQVDQFEVPAMDGIPEVFGSLATCDTEPVGFAPLSADHSLVDLLSLSAVTNEGCERPCAFTTVFHDHETTPAAWSFPAFAIELLVQSLLSTATAEANNARRKPILTLSTNSSPSLRRTSVGTANDDPSNIFECINVLRGALKDVAAAAPPKGFCAVGSSWANPPSNVVRSLVVVCCSGADGAFAWNRAAIRRLALTLIQYRLRYPPTIEELLLYYYNLKTGDVDADGLVTKQEFDTTLTCFETTSSRCRSVLNKLAALSPVAAASKSNNASRRTSLGGALSEDAAVAQGGERDADVPLNDHMVASTASARLQEARCIRAILWLLYAEHNKLNYESMLLELAADPRWSGRDVNSSHAKDGFHQGKSHSALAVGSRRLSSDATQTADHAQLFCIAGAPMLVSSPAGTITVSAAGSPQSERRHPEAGNPTYSRHARNIGLIKALILSKAGECPTWPEIGGVWSKAAAELATMNVSPKCVQKILAVSGSSSSLDIPPSGMPLMQAVSALGLTTPGVLSFFQLPNLLSLVVGTHS